MRILVVTHEASRTGAPRIALLAATCMIDQGHQVQVISRMAGPLIPAFEQVAPTSIEFLGRVRRRLQRLSGVGRFAWLLDTVLAMVTIVRRRPDLVYVNSSAAAVYVLASRCLRLRTVMHVHESGSLTERFLRRAHVSTTLHDVTLVACSPSVHTALCELADRPAERVAVVPSVPDQDEVLARSREVPDHAYTDELVVGCCGSVEHRKGADLWMDAAALVRSAMPTQRIRFVWVGEISEPVGAGLEADFIGPSANPYAHMSRFDVATLPSRDDPFPLVVLESMLVGTPVVAFDVGSVAAQIGDTGVVVPPLDTEAFAGGLVRMLSDEGERRRLGVEAKARVLTLYSTRSFATALSGVLIGGSGS